MKEDRQSTAASPVIQRSTREVDFNVVSSSSAASTSEHDGSSEDLASLPESSALAPVDDDYSSDNSITTRLYGIRHGLSVSNEWMQIEENAWGAATFNDEHNFPDAPLSQTGIQQATALRQRLLEPTTNGGAGDSWLQSVELIVVSPLTRCLQTYQHAVEPLFFNNTTSATTTARPPVVLALPLLTERVYTVSETGRPVSILQRDFPTVDWSEFQRLRWCNPDCWWYDPSVETPFNHHCDNVWREWRPAGQGQRYGAAGEPMPVFERRMEALHQWLLDRPERHILAVAHWGVFRHFTNGKDLDNCQIITMDLKSNTTAVRP